MSKLGWTLCDRLLSMAQHRGAEAVAFVRESDTGNVRFAAGEITTSGEVSSAAARLTLAYGRRHATVTTNQTGDHALTELVDRCTALAKVAPDDPEYMPPLGRAELPHNGDAWDEATASLPPTERASFARAALDRADKKSLVASGFISSGADRLTLATSAGLRASHEGTWAQMSTTMRGGGGSGWAGTDATRAANVDAGALAMVAADKAERSRGVTRLDPGRYTVILEPAAVADLLGFLVEALDARAVDQGRSYFSHPPAGLDPRLSLRSDPLDPITPGCPWDEEGVRLMPTTWIGEGKVQTLHTTRFWAHKSGRKPTGEHGTFQLSCPAGAGSPSVLVSGVKRGLLVTRFWYIRWLEPKRLVVTGLTRDGVWLVEDGKIVRPVNNFRFNASPITMFDRLVDATAVTYRVSSFANVVRVPVVCCNDFEMSSVSDAV